MQTLVVYDSYFGNTEAVARRIAGELGAEARLLRAAEATAERVAAAGLVVVGSPTRGFRASEATQRFLQGLPPRALRGKFAAAFDTGIAAPDIPSAGLRLLVRWFGYASGPIAKVLVKKGGRLAAPAVTFRVQDTKGPLVAGELEQAAEWARRLAAAGGRP